MKSLIKNAFQVVTLATYVFFIFTVIGRQKIDTLKKGEYMRSGRMPMDIDLYIPIFTILQFYFYMGLLKVKNFRPLLILFLFPTEILGLSKQTVEPIADPQFM